MASNAPIIVRQLIPTEFGLDFSFGAGLNNYLQNNAAIAQNINSALNAVLGNCWFDLADGIDWFNLLGSKNIVPLNLAISTTILNVSGVQSIQQIAFDLSSNRNYTVNYKVQTVFSSVSNSFTFTTSPK